MLDMRAMKHKPSLLEECGSTPLPALNCTSTLSLQLKKKQKPNVMWMEGRVSDLLQRKRKEVFS